MLPCVELQRQSNYEQGSLAYGNLTAVKTVLHLVEKDRYNERAMKQEVRHDIKETPSTVACLLTQQVV